MKSPESRTVPPSQPLFPPLVYISLSLFILLPTSLIHHAPLISCSITIIFLITVEDYLVSLVKNIYQNQEIIIIFTPSPHSLVDFSAQHLCLVQFLPLL